MTTGKQEFLDGFRLVLPILVAPVSFSFITGAISVQKGLSAFEATLMSASVFAGGGHPPPIIFLPVVVAVWVAGHLALGGVGWLARRGAEAGGSPGTGSNEWSMPG